MMQGQALKYLMVLTITVKCVDSLEIVLSKTNDGTDLDMEHLESFRNKSYQIPLFQTRYLTVRTHRNDFHSKYSNEKNVVGFKFQIRSSQPNVVNIRKTVELSGEETKLNTVLVEDLYILPRKRALAHIFNAYPSPTLIRPKQKSIHDLAIDSTWSLKGYTMDVTELTIRLDVFFDDDTSTAHNWNLKVLVTQPKRRIDTIFYVIIPFMVITISVLMGILLDTTVIKGIVQKPIPVLVGFVAQYGMMPFLAMAIAKIFRYTPLNSLALFVIGCCPGSGASNQWTVIFEGDVNLSAVMSFVSTATSFVMMPLYFYTIGRIYMDDLAIRVPFLGLARTLGMVVVPYATGIVISHFFPKTRLVIQKLIKPMMICLMLFFLTFGMAVNWYLFMMIDLYTALTAPLLPFIGFLLGGVIAKVCQMEWKYVKTIAIEAGIQNTGIAFMIIMYSFPQPYATQALIVPMVVAFLTTKPFWVILIIRNRIRKYQKQKAEKKANANGDLVITDEKPIENNHVSENMQQL